MFIATGVTCLLIGTIVMVGQAISAINFTFAQKLGLQEEDAHTEALFRRLELNTARWDLVVLWTLPLAGILMLLGHTWWPTVSLVAGGVHVDAAGREIAKLLGLRAQAIATGGPREQRAAHGFLALIGVVGVWLIVLGALHLG